MKKTQQTRGKWPIFGLYCIVFEIVSSGANSFIGFKMRFLSSGDSKNAIFEKNETMNENFWENVWRIDFFALSLQRKTKGNDF